MLASKTHPKSCQTASKINQKRCLKFDAFFIDFLVDFGGILGLSRSISGLSWDILGLSWDILGLSWAPCCCQDGAKMLPRWCQERKYNNFIKFYKKSDLPGSGTHGGGRQVTGTVKLGNSLKIVLKLQFFYISAWSKFWVPKSTLQSTH